MVDPKVVVVVPVYNRPISVLEALDSISVQSHRPDHLIIVDDGSTDNTAYAVQDWIDQNSNRISCRLLIQQTNQGSSAARNLGIEAAGDCDYIAFLDSDDLWPKDFLERTLIALEASPDAVAASCDQEFSEDGKSSLRQVSRVCNDTTRWLFAHTRAIVQASLFRADALHRVGGFDADQLTGKDTKFVLEMSLKGDWVHVSGDPIMIRRGLTKNRGEEGHLSVKYDDGIMQRIRMLERFATGTGRDALPAITYRKYLGRHWCAASRRMLAAGQKTYARECLQRSLYWNPILLRSWFLRLKMLFTK